MKSIEFKKQGFLYYLHKFMFVNDSSDTCNYKGQLMISFIVCLITIHATILRALTFLSKSVRKDYESYGFKFQIIFFMLALILMLLGFHGTEDTEIFPDLIFWRESSFLEIILYSFVIEGIGILILTITMIMFAILYGIGFSFLTICGYLYNIININIPNIIRDEDGEPSTQLGELYLSAKHKFCKKINWK